MPMSRNTTSGANVCDGAGRLARIVDALRFVAEHLQHHRHRVGRIVIVVDDQRAAARAFGRYPPAMASLSSLARVPARAAARP